MPSKAVYTGLALARSDTGCSTVLIPWVEESVMVTPEVVGHIAPVCTVVLRRTARREIGSRPHQSLPSVPGMAAIAAAGLAHLLDADQVARGIAEGPVANPARLLARLLDHPGG